MEIIQNDNDSKVSQLSRTLDRRTNNMTIVGNYLARKAINTQGDMAVTTWHKSIGEISSEAAKAGFMIANIVEPKPLPRMEQLSPKDYKALVKIPYFVIFKLLKQADSMIAA